MKNLFHLAIAFSLVGILALSAAALLADPIELNRKTTVEREKDRTQPIDKPLQPCPWPPCMAPCQFPAPPEVICVQPLRPLHSITAFGTQPTCQFSL